MGYLLEMQTQFIPDFLIDSAETDSVDLVGDEPFEADFVEIVRDAEANLAGIYSAG